MKDGHAQIRVLVVDDQAENRQLEAEILHEAGFMIQEASNGAEALAIAQDWQPDLILMDMRMPVMDGYEAIRRIKSSGQGDKIPIIAVTASAFADDEQEVLRSGADGYVRKPFKEDELFQAIGNSLNLQFDQDNQFPLSSALSSPSVPLVPIKLPANLSDQTIAQLRQAVLTANIGKLLGIIDRIAPEHPLFASQLRQLANNYQYDSLLVLLDRNKML